MKMTVKERYLLPRLFPTKGNLDTQLAIRDIRKKIKIDEKEAEEIELKKINNRLQWNTKKAKEKEIKFSSLELKVLKDSVNELDKKKEITPDLVDLCLKIKEGK
ncbi:MAG: hypothetical protein ACOC56_06020 [Atribacterota bacterium]